MTETEKCYSTFLEFDWTRKMLSQIFKKPTWKKNIQLWWKEKYNCDIVPRIGRGQKGKEQSPGNAIERMSLL